MAKIQSNNSLKTKREIAKIGMTASLGILTLSAFMLKNKSAKKLHTAAGIALIGFSFWHHKLYQTTEKIDSKPLLAPAPQTKIQRNRK